jgi:hypothetical protein
MYCSPALTPHGSLDLKQEIQIQIQITCKYIVWLNIHKAQPWILLTSVVTSLRIVPTVGSVPSTVSSSDPLINHNI